MDWPPTTVLTFRRVARSGPQAVGDLVDQFAGRREDQRLGRLGRRLARLIQQRVDQRQAEGQRLAGAGLGEAEDVVSFSASGIACVWIGVGWVKPALPSASFRAGLRPSVSKSNKCIPRTAVGRSAVPSLQPPRLARHGRVCGASGWTGVSRAIRHSRLEPCVMGN
jgi:hypothetical protein